MDEAPELHCGNKALQARCLYVPESPRVEHDEVAVRGAIADGMMLAGCKGRHADQPDTVVGSLYTEVVARHPVGIPGPADMRAFAPYLSHGLLEKVHEADGCTNDFFAKNQGPDGRPEISWAGLRLFAGETFSGDGRREPDGFKIEKTELEKDGSFRVSLEISRKETDTYTFTAPVAVIVRKERGKYVVDDEIYQSEHTRWVNENTQKTYSTDDARLSEYLSVGCGAVAKLIQGLYTQVMARPAHDAASPEDWTASAPYLSQALLHKIDVATACSEDWGRQNPYPPLNVPMPTAEGFVSGRYGYSDPTGFELQLTRPEKDAALRVYVNLTKRGQVPERDYGWRVAPSVIREGGRYVVDDVVYATDGDWDDYPQGMPADRRFSGYLAAGCDGVHWIRSSLPNEPVAMMRSFYEQVVARKPLGVPAGEDWKVFAPYLSKGLLQKIDVYEACMSDWDRQYGKSDPPVKSPGLGEDGLFSGGNELASPADFRIESAQEEKNGSVRVDVALRWRDWMYRDNVLNWRVADVLVQENGRYVVDDVIFLKNKKINIDADYTLSHILSMSGECDGRRWVGYKGGHKR